jgi:hypothetical protein
MFYKVLTPEELNYLTNLKRTYGNDRVSYEKEVEKYLEDIRYEDRLVEYLSDKWYMKALQKICNRKKKHK